MSQNETALPRSGSAAAPPPAHCNSRASAGLTRIDALLAARGLFESRAQAQAAVRAGLVRVNGTVAHKAAQLVAPDAALEAQAAHPYVSRGGVKLAHALDHFGLSPQGMAALDIGASTGGFTQVLLARGARHVTAVDVGHGQLHARLRADPRVTSLEKRDARALSAGDLAEPAGFITCDVSFISLALVLEPVLRLAARDAILAALVKPQFEAGRALVGRGVVRDEAVHRAVCDAAEALVARLGWTSLGVTPSPIEGGDGNREFLLAARR